MKRIAILVVFSMVLLAAPFSLRAYDDSACQFKILPECIWAAATGGGTWVTEVQITNLGGTAADVSVWFIYGGGFMRGSFTLTAGLASLHTVKYSNILSTIDGLDSGAFTYYGRVGAVWFQTASTSAIHVTAKTVNGNYGKTFPGLIDSEAKTAAQGRLMMIPLLVNNATYRTTTGFFNTSNSATYTVSFYITNANYLSVGSFTKTFVPFDYQAFNPFVEAGISSGTYDNYFLLVWPTAGGSAIRGLMCYGATANKISNDPAALIAYPFNTTAYPSPLQAPAPLMNDPQK